LTWVNAPIGPVPNPVLMMYAKAVPDSRRRALMKGAAAALALLAAPKGLARPPLLTRAEPDAVALEFVDDAATLDATGQPLYQAGSRCAGCFFFQGDAGDETAPCTVFAGWRVPRSGWCREFAPRH